MRPKSLRVAVWISALSVLISLFVFASLTFAQTNSHPKRDFLQQPLYVTTVAGLGFARPAFGVQPDTTTDTWTGGGGSNTDWSDNSNWNNGAPSGQNVLINLTTAATVEDDSASIGTLTLSNAGDSVTVSNNTTLTVGGNVSNNGTITLNSTGNDVELNIGASLTLSGSGSLVLGGSCTTCDYVLGASGSTLTINQGVSGYGTIGYGELVLVNNSTINANGSGDSLEIDPSAASTNTGTMEATNGGILELSGQSWTNTGATIAIQSSSICAPASVSSGECGAVSSIVVAIGQPERNSDSSIQRAIWRQ